MIFRLWFTNLELEAIKGTEQTFREGNYVKNILPSLWKGVYSKRKEFAP